VDFVQVSLRLSHNCGPHPPSGCDVLLAQEREPHSVSDAR